MKAVVTRLASISLPTCLMANRDSERVFRDEHMVKGLMERIACGICILCIGSPSVSGFNCPHSDQTWALKSLDTRHGEGFSRV
jgi:hypothetical protein